MSKLISTFLVIFSTAIVGCGGGGGSSTPPVAGTPPPMATATVAPTPTLTPTITPAPSPTFSSAQARENLSFAKTQTLKMLEEIEDRTQLLLPSQCSNIDSICFPRAMDDDKIQMSRPSQWTNGFWPGNLWKLLVAETLIDNFSQEEKTRLLSAARLYTTALFDEAERTNTHDLGFILFDSLGEALAYEGLTEEERTRYQEVLATGRTSLASRYSSEFATIRSWDWTPRFRTSYLDNGTERRSTFDLANPWQFPVIIDNLMNLEFLLDGNDAGQRDIALSHAQKTLENHYHFLDDDPTQERPVAYHVFDYDSMRPGNWQGLGNISAWSRGQGWSLYGYVSIADLVARDNLPTEGLPDFLAHAKTLVGSVKSLMGDDYVPPWDFLADTEAAASIAANTSPQTTIYSRILDLCDYQIADDVLPYRGYGPIQFDTNILSEDSVTELSGFQSVKNEALIVGDKVVPCGTDAYDLEGRDIPEDSSAAALIASALYRLAQMTDDTVEKSEYIDFADEIMAALTADYRNTDGPASELGFILRAASGNVAGGSEVDTSIIYADFYFIEANMRKLALEP